ncbi:MAG TPA: protein phosphatase 2C domain-containing protein [Caulobacteraceae bacterium]|jgi:serine/threonine protein phosphatase PrpC|nr:protein phosphatase 2C domain-containing protein [Caulobacteraceae bacterium]
MPLTVAARTHVGCKRKVNEDAVLDRPDLGLWAVADGMGGHKAGDVASAMIVERLGSASLNGDLPDRIEEVRRRLHDANSRLIELRTDEQSTIGSTVVVLAVERSAFACLWAGDSRAYRLRGGELTQITRDHSLVQDLVDVGELRPEDARGHPNANVITRAVGASRPLEIDLVAGEVHSGDVFLLASDGLTKVVDDRELATHLRAPEPNVCADHLLAMTLERGAPDNVSLIVLRAD